MEMRWWGPMVAVQCTDVLLSILSKAAMSRGMSRYVYVVYSNALATILLFPDFFFNRNKRPPLTFHLLSGCLLLGQIGISFGQILLSIGEQYSSPTLCSAMNNLIPAFTFLLAVIFSMEKMNIRSSSGQATSLGTLVLISGAIMITFYKGTPINIIQSPSNLHDHQLLSSQSNWVLGGLILSIPHFLAALRKIVLASITKEYRSKRTIVFFHCLFETISGAIFSLIEVRNLSAWRFKPDIELITIVCSALFGSVLRNGIHTWVVHKKDAVYVLMFRPLRIIIEVIVGVTFLGDTLHVGSVVGVILIALGFYAVFWGKTKEEKMGEEDIPLLQSEDEEP